ncbi:MAG: TRAP transporter large permease subunit [Treponema sp.]|jgi:tripartite ATP-independent transporter DctM subunit|nr:TRAP transporter large permease subunit [Treponema sp.]
MKFLLTTLRRFERGLCYTALTALALLPVAIVVARLVFKTGIPDSGGLTSHLLLVIGLMSGMLTTQSREHLSIALIQNFGNDKLKTVFAVINNLLSAFILVMVAVSSVPFIMISLSPPRLIGFIPNQVFALVIPIGYTVMAFRFALQAPLSGKARILPLLTLTLGIIASIPMLAKAIWGFDTPDSVYELTDLFYTVSYYIKMPLLIMLLIAALVGTPLFVVMGGLAIALIQGAGNEIDVVALQVYNTLSQENFIAIPLFTLVGFFLSESKSGTRLVSMFKSLFSWLPGGMIIATVVICAFFTSFTGASGVTILALGGILYSILHDVKYEDKFSEGLLTSAGSIGLLFPPSIPIILVGTATLTNILHIFVGAFIPGLVLVFAIIVFGIVASVKTRIPVSPFKPKEALLAIKAAGFEILLPVLLITGYFSGILSTAEIGGAAVVYIFIVEVVIHRDIKLRDIPRVFAKSVPIIGGVLSILALSQALSYYIVDTQAPENLARWMLNAINSKYLFLLLLNVVLLVVGCLMDIFSAILIVLPLIMPLGEAYGINSVHLLIIFITNLEVGFLTPPVGMNLFLASYRFKKPFVEICRSVFPFLCIQLVVLILVTYIPWFSTFLTQFF